MQVGLSAELHAAEDLFGCDSDADVFYKSNGTAPLAHSPQATL